MSPLPDQPISPLDGRYRGAVGELGELPLRGGTQPRADPRRGRVAALPDRPSNCSDPIVSTSSRLASFASWHPNSARRRSMNSRALEATTRHDVKAVEYLVRRKLDELGPRPPSPNSPTSPARAKTSTTSSYALTIGAAVREIWLPKLHAVIALLRGWALEHRDAPCSPTHTASRRRRPRSARSSRSSSAGSSASPHRSRRPSTWASSAGRPARSRPMSSAGRRSTGRRSRGEFVDSLGLDWNPLTTQIEPHDWQAELYARIGHANRILHNLCTDIWAYISMGYFTPDPAGGRDRVVHDAAQDQPDPVRERGGEPRALERAARLARPRRS